MGQTILEINGKRYDATTGRIIQADNASVTPAAVSGRNIDGVVSAPKSSATHQAPKVRTSVPHISSTRGIHDITLNRRPKLQKSQTLMRQMVKKPTTAVHAHVPQPESNSQISVQNKSYAAAKNNQARLHRAMSMTTHSAVAKFQPHSAHRVDPKIVPLSVRSEQTDQHAPAVQISAQPAPQKHAHNAQKFVESQLEKAVAQRSNTPHHQSKPFYKRAFRKPKKSLSFAAATLAVLLLAGFLAYQNTAYASFLIARRGAGLAVGIPTGIPSNFALSNKVEYTKGQIVMTYHSRVDDRKFTVTLLENDDLTTESLKDAIKNTATSYQTYQSGGVTLLITGPGEADWIDGDLRYSISGDSGLTSEQLASIATSL